MKLLYKHLKTMMLVFLISGIAGSAVFAQATGTLDIQAKGPNSVVLKVDTTDATGIRVEYKEDGAATYTEITSFDATVSAADGFAYLLHTGLNESTTYEYSLTPVGAGGDGAAVTVTVTTLAKEIMSHLKFDTEVNGNIVEELRGTTDSMWNATLVPSINESLGSAIKFERTEDVPGIFTNSAVYLDSALLPVYFHEPYPGVQAATLTELSYGFWFKVNDLDMATSPGSVLFAGGDHFGSAVGLWNDSIWLGTAAKFSGNNLAANAGYPFSDDGWHHVTVVYDKGTAKLFLDGEEVISYTEDDWFWTRLSVRLHDHWAKTMIGAVKWWNRPANGIFPENYGDNVWHNQFNGLMDELVFYTYAIDQTQINELLAAGLPTVSNLEVAARGPNSVVLQFAAPDADTFRVEVKTGTEEFAEVTPARYVFQNGAHYVLVNGMDPAADYTLNVVPVAGGSDGIASSVDVTTRAEEMWAYLPFDTEVNGSIVEETMGTTDSMWNATLVPSVNEAMGNAIKFERTEDVPGIYTNSAVFLDSAFMHIFDQTINGNEKATTPTELSYTFWFKNNDPALATDPGSVMFLTGDQFGSAVGLYNDSIWVATAAKFGGNNLGIAQGAPFENGDWHHLAFVYEDGLVQLYLDGNEVVSYTEEEWFWNRLGVRPDHWAKTMIGAGFWWNRPANNIFPTNYGDQQWHNQFNGLMDEFKLFSYALTQDDIQAMVSDVKATLSKLDVTARGPNSVVLEFSSDAADTFRVEVKTGEEEFVVVSPAKNVVHNDVHYYLINGLDVTSDYTFRVVPVSAGSDGVASTVEATTFAEEMWAYLTFDSETNGRVTEETMGRSDSLINATLVPSVVDGLGQAVKFERTETIPGSDIYNNSAIFLDSSLWHIYYQTINGNERAATPTELSYTFWFKNNNDTLARDEGSVMFLTGDQFGSAVGLYNDSIWVATAAKFGGTNLGIAHGTDFENGDWHHLAFVYEEGMVKLYLDAQEVISYTEEEWFWNRLGTRPDQWAKTMIGAGYWWNRPANNIFPTNYGDKQWHNQFNGLMDEFKLFSYAISQEEITAMVDAIVSREDRVYKGIDFYPNPATDVLNFRNLEEGVVSIYDISGRKVLDKKLQFENTLNISTLAKGVYFIRLESGNQIYTGKFVKE